MKWVRALLGMSKNPIGEIGGVIDRLTTTGEERAEIRAKVLSTLVEAQSQVIVAEANAGGLAALWRPLTMLSFGAMLWWFILSSTFGWPPPDLSTVPPELWTLMTVGLGGYAGGRSLEKVVGMVTAGKRKKNQE